MENYIFIIIAVVLAIFSATKKKPKEDNAENLTTSRPSDPFEDLLFHNDRSENPITSPPSENIVQTKRPEHQTIEEKKQELHQKSTSRKKKKSDERVRPIVPDPNERNTSKSSIQHSLKRNFSLKQAVIYSEILNRKY